MSRFDDHSCPTCEQRVHDPGVLFLQRFGDDTYVFEDLGEVSLVDRKTLVSMLEEYLEQGGIR